MGGIPPRIAGERCVLSGLWLAFDLKEYSHRIGKRELKRHVQYVQVSSDQGSLEACEI